jgi:hypothetical protein
LADNLYVDSSSAALTISGGGRVVSPNATVGISGGNTANRLSVASQLSIPGTLNVGYDGTGNLLDVGTGGSAAVGSLWVGGVATSASNSATVAATGTLAATSAVIVGYGGRANQLSVSGLVTSPQTFLGYQTGADANVATVAAAASGRMRVRSRWASPRPATRSRYRAAPSR